MQHIGTSRNTDVAAWWPPGELLETGLFSLELYNNNNNITTIIINNNDNNKDLFPHIFIVNDILYSGK
jgi:hypothetical protein